MEIILQNQKFQLLHEGAIYWNAKETLILADIHLGKSSISKYPDLTLPFNKSNEVIGSLDLLLNKFLIKKLIILGDLFHYKTAGTEEIIKIFKEWRNSKGVEIILTKGNNDKLKDDVYSSLDIEVMNIYKENSFTFSHCQNTEDGNFNFSGHIHPALKIERKNVKSVQKCFVKGENYLILPSFGELTQSHIESPSTEKEYYLITENKIIKF